MNILWERPLSADYRGRVLHLWFHWLPLGCDERLELLLIEPAVRIDIQVTERLA